MRIFVIVAFVIVSSVSAFATEIISYNALVDDEERKFHNIEVCNVAASTGLLIAEWTETVESELNDKLKTRISYKDYLVENADSHSIFRIHYINMREKGSKNIFRVSCTEAVLTRW